MTPVTITLGALGASLFLLGFALGRLRRRVPALGFAGGSRMRTAQAAALLADDSHATRFAARCTRELHARMRGVPATDLTGRKTADRYENLLKAPATASAYVRLVQDRYVREFSASELEALAGVGRLIPDLDVRIPGFLARLEADERKFAERLWDTAGDAVLALEGRHRPAQAPALDVQANSQTWNKRS